MDMRGFYTFISERRSIRRYRYQRVPRESIERILQAGTWAPSAHNSQPWQFLVLESLAMKRRLAKAMAKPYQQDLEKDGCSPEEIKEILATSISHFTAPPVLLLVGLTMEAMTVYPDAPRQQAEYVMAVQSVAAAIQNILLAVHTEGLGACWHCAPLFCPDEVRTSLELPASFIPQALITVGYPDETPVPPDRRPSAEVRQYR